MQNYQDLKVWQRAHHLALAVYAATQVFPREERFGLTNQVRRASGSVPANIAEGCGRFGPGEFAHFLTIAHGSACELDYHLLLARDLGYLPVEIQARLAGELIEIRRMIIALWNKLKHTA